MPAIKYANFSSTSQPMISTANSTRSLLCIILIIIITSFLLLLSNQPPLIYNILGYSIRIPDHQTQSFCDYVSNVPLDVLLDWYKLIDLGFS